MRFILSYTFVLLVGILSFQLQELPIALLTVVMYGLAGNMLKMVRGEPKISESGFRFKVSAIAPIIILLILAAVMFFIVVYCGITEQR